MQIREIEGSLLTKDFLEELDEDKVEFNLYAVVDNYLLLINDNEMACYDIY